MQAEDLSVKERAVLFALLGEARELSNPQLEEHVGFRLTGKERRALNERKLVESRRAGQTYVHELSDAGWHWCTVELSAGPKARATSMERALYAVLGGIARHLDETQQSLASIFGRTEPGSADLGELITSAYDSLASGPGEFVALSELRRRLAGIAREDVDSALERLYQAHQVNLVPQSNQQALSEADRQSSVDIGGERKHMISVRQR
jgi:hypothetical protein